MDEIQKTKNPSADLTKAVRLIRSEYRWGMSGTPVENHLGDLIAICETIKPDIFSGVNVESTVRVINAYAPIFLRRRKADVLADLPQKIIKEVWIDLLPEQRRRYDLAFNQGKIELQEKGEQLQLTNVLALLSKLKQICNFDEIEGNGAKLDYLKNNLETIQENGDKALVFSQYPNETLKHIKPHLSDYKAEIYHGGLSDKSRAQMVANFQNKEDSQVMLISLKAGNSGITLTRANYVFHFDLWWNPAVSAQAVDRTHRIGQEKTVMEIFLLAKDTIESEIYDILSKKKKLFDEVVNPLTDTSDKMDHKESSGARNQAENLDILQNGSLTEAEYFGLFGLSPGTRNRGLNSKRKVNINLLDPFEFEHFIGSLFEKMGYHAKVTQKSRDGGIDIYAKQQTTLGIDEVIIQCKHRQDSNSTVGEKDVRELFGVLSSKTQIAKAILVTNGLFTSGAKNFAEGKPIALIDGAQLVGLTAKFLEQP